MTKNAEGVLLKKSKLTTNGKPNLPAPSKLVEGELAINYAEGVETISTKNESGTVVTFSSDDYFKNQYLAWEKGENVGSAKIVANSGITSGAFAISEGHGTSAITEGTYGGAHAEGYNTIASGNCTHAEGCTTSAMTQGMPGGVHAEGVSTFASGQGAHAEGSGSKAITNSPGAHAEGNNCVASGQGTHAEGISTSATTQGMPGVHAEGNGTWASDGAAHAEGNYTRAMGQSSHAEGNATSATTNGAHAEGNATLASGQASHAEGCNTKANGYYGHAEGYQTSATSYQSHAEGYQTVASGSSSHAEGYGTKASGQNSHTEGNSTSATSQYSHAEGNATIASGDSSHAEGWDTVAGGRYGSHAEGYQTKATAYYNSHAEGYGSIATGNYGSHAEGNNSIAEGASSHAEGCSTSATSYYSHSEGYHTLASGQASHAEGYETIANGSYSHVEGKHTIANNYFEHASGLYNISSSASTTFGHSGNTLFSIGNGEGYNTRHNAFEIRQNGDIYIVNKAGQDVRLQDEIGNIDVDQVLDETTSASTNPVATQAVYNVYHEFETVVSAAINDLNTNKFGYAEYDSTDKKIYFYKNSTETSIPLCEINATNFIKDGMVDNVEVKDVTSGGSQVTCLVITFNTDSGKEDINIPISDIFDASNYYTKSETSGKTELSTEFALYVKKADVDQTIDSTTSASTNPVATSAVFDFVTASTPTVDQVLDDTTSASTNPVSTKAVYSAITDNEMVWANAYVAMSGAISSHTEDTDVHVTAADKTAWGNKADGNHTHDASGITAMTDYQIASSSASVLTTDTLLQTIGKLEKRIELLEAALGGMTLVKLTSQQYADLAVKDPNTMYIIND